jgi:hypothetical protein
MAQRDKIHNAVKTALVKDGWEITHDPYIIEYEETTLQADLGAERPIGAQRNGQKIVVEIKSFLGPSFMRELEYALGQYQVYLSYLEIIAPERQLYLAVSERIYTKFFHRKSVQRVVERHQLALLIVDLKTEEVVLWTK